MKNKHSEFSEPDSDLTEFLSPFCSPRERNQHGEVHTILNVGLWHPCVAAVVAVAVHILQNQCDLTCLCCDLQTINLGQHNINRLVCLQTLINEVHNTHKVGTNRLVIR